MPPAMIAPEINPVAISIGPLKIHWYGLTYVSAFVAAWALGVLRARKPGSGWKAEEVGDLIVAGAFGVILGGRLGYIIFYKAAYYVQHPIEIFYVWQGGMSFHGGLIGVIVAMLWYARKTRRSWSTVLDFQAPLVPLGLGAGRLGNFINQELWGKVSDAPWAMVFRTGGPLPRHPSQLYEFALEGVVLFAIVWWFSSRVRPPWAVSALFVFCYGCFRFLVEFYRQPDTHLGYLAFNWFTMGHLLSLPMILAGGAVLWWSYHRSSPITS
ncbi:MAG: prolipoprotein diacylglyceryl transferase [Acidiferrobacterales bacterium]